MVLDSLWNIIRDWFVVNIFGGWTSSEVSYRFPIGHTYSADNGFIMLDTAYTYLPIKLYSDDWETFIDNISIGDWLSTMSTIIVLIALCFFFFLMVRWLFRLTSGLIQGRG